MFKFKVGALLGFAVGWAVGSGRAAEIWDRMQQAMFPDSRAPEAAVAARSTFERPHENVSANERSMASA